MDIKRGDVWYVEKKNDTTGHEQWSGRPGIVISDNEINRGANTVEIVYLTTRPKQKSATHVPIFACGRSSTAGIRSGTGKTCTIIFALRNPRIYTLISPEIIEPLVLSTSKIRMLRILLWKKS